MIRNRPVVLLLVALLLAALGCASAPPQSFYTLSSGLRPAPGVPRPGPSVVVGRAAVPDLVDRPQLVVQAGGNRVVILEQQRWAEPLRAAIPRVVAENLGQVLGGGRVSTRDEVISQPDCRVDLDVRRFDARPGAAVEIDALWTVSCGGTAPRVGQSLVREPVRGRDYQAVVVAHGRALDSVSRDIGREVLSAL